MNILKSLATVITAGVLSVGSFLGLYHPTNQVTNDVAPAALGAFNPSGGGTYRLQTSLGSTDTTIRLSSFKEPISNTPYTMAYLNSSIGYGTLDPQQPTRSEFISFTGITQNSDGTASLTGVVRGLGRSYPYAASTTLSVAHSGQSIFILSDSPSLFNEYAIKRNVQSITGIWTFASTSAPVYDADWNIASTSLSLVHAKWVYNNFVNNSETQTINGIKTFTLPPVVPYSSASSSAASVGYVNGVALAGAPNANTTTKGVVEEATTAEINAGTQAGGTGAELFINPLAFSTSNFTPPSISVATTAITALTVNTPSLSVPVVANNKLLVFGQMSINCQQQPDVYIYVKSNINSTTSISHVNNDGCAVGKHTSIFMTGYYLATTTETIKLFFGDAGGLGLGLSGDVTATSSLTYVKSNT